LKKTIKKTTEKDNIFEKSSKKAEIPQWFLSFFNHTQLLKTGFYVFYRKYTSEKREKVAKFG
jgi:hypothetical protein